MKTLDKDYILTTLSEEQIWKIGESDTFIFEDWELTLRKDDAFKYSVNGEKSNSNETWSRRYKSMDDAFLHILNHFNENANIKSRYETLDEYIRRI